MHVASYSKNKLFHDPEIVQVLRSQFHRKARSADAVELLYARLAHYLVGSIPAIDYLPTLVKYP